MGVMTNDRTTIQLSRSGLREVAGYPAACARPVLAIFEREYPDDRRPRAAIGGAQAFVHPLAKATQVEHILGSAAHAARASALCAGDDPTVGAAHLAQARILAPAVVDVLRRYPSAPGGGGRVGELIRQLDAALRGGPTGG
jgi:hypothetical protein